MSRMGIPRRRMHRFDHVHVPHPPHSAGCRPQAQEHLQRHGPDAVGALQPIRHRIERHRGAYAGLQPAPARQLSDRADRECRYRVFLFVPDGVITEKRGRFNFDVLEATERRIATRPFGRFEYATMRG